MMKNMRADMCVCMHACLLALGERAKFILFAEKNASEMLTS